MQSDAKTVKEYLAELPEDRRRAVQAVRKIILSNLPEGYEEGMYYGMITYVVPLALFPKGYLDNPTMPLCYTALASQKNYMSLYMMYGYGDTKKKEQFERDYAKSGKKLDMGKSCIRFKNIEQLALDVIGKAIASTSVSEYIRKYEISRKKG